MHLDATIPNFVTQEYTKQDEAESNLVYKTCYERDGGYISIPQEPGLGVELDDKLIEQNTFEALKELPPLRIDGSVANSV